MSNGFKRVIEIQLPATAAGADFSIPAVVPFTGVITDVEYIPKAGITGANTDSRTLTIVNKGQSGSGTTNIVTKAYTSGVNANSLRKNSLALSATAADLVVTAGDVLTVNSTHVGSTGLADPGGLVQITVQRS
jgi:hypothetical protein